MKIKSIEKEDVKYLVKNALTVIIGTLVLAFGTGVFLVPFSLVTGGLTGLSIAMAEIIKLEFLTVDLMVTVLTWMLFFFGWLFLGTNFAFKTLISAIVYPIALSVFMRLPSDDVLNGFFNLAGSETYGEIAIILAGIFGGVFVGAGCAITFKGGGSTGGLDIIALIVCKFIKKLKSSHMIFVLDAFVVVFGMLAIGDFVLCLVGIVSAFIAALVIDKMFLGRSQAFVAHIVSDKYEKINEAVINKLDRTSTIISAVGGYSGADKKMVMVSFTMRQYAEFIALIHSIDREAFVTVQRAHEINGEGWTKYDIKKKERN